MAGKKQDLISIVCTLYNYRGYIGELIESVLAQTYKNWELFIVDDGSTDKPLEVIRPYLRDKRICYFAFEKNKGYSKAKNEGIIKSKGEYIVMIDADDKLTECSLEVRYKALQKHPDSLWCHGEALVLSKDGVLNESSHKNRMKLRQNYIDQGNDLTKKYFTRLVHAQSVMVRRDLHRLIGLYDEKLKCSSDTEMWDRIIRFGYIPTHVNQFVCIYRQHDRQMHNSIYKKDNAQSIIKYRKKSTQRRLDEGIKTCNTRLLVHKKPKLNLRDLVLTHHGKEFGFSLHYMTLYSMVLGLEAKQVFEFGCGYSTRAILKALERTNGRLITNDVRPAEDCKVFNEGDIPSKFRWLFYQGLSKDVLPTIKFQPLDLVLHDGAHNVPTVYEDIRFIVPHMKVNSLLVIHDTDHKYIEINNAITKALKNINHEKITLPYGCGLTIVKILQDFGNGTITTTWKKEN